MSERCRRGVTGSCLANHSTASIASLCSDQGDSFRIPSGMDEQTFFSST